MRFSSFFTITLLALAYAGLTIAETAMYKSWDRAQNEQKIIQAKVNYVQKLNNRIERLLSRMAIDSQHDPALTKLLKEHGFNVVVREPVPISDATAPVEGNAGTGTTPPVVPLPGVPTSGTTTPVPAASPHP
jgi:hypothetical protein